MKNKDQILLESLYERILLKESSDEEYMRLAENPEENKEALQRMVNDASGFSKINPPKKVNFYRNYLEIAARQGYYTQEEVERYANQYADPATEGVTAADRERDFIKYWVAEKILENGIEQNWRQSLNLAEAIVTNNSTPKQARVSVANWVNTILPPVTYDDAGNIIPLSQRFNSTKDDIRH